jgi:hypothetical protein
VSTTPPVSPTSEKILSRAARLWAGGALVAVAAALTLLARVDPAGHPNLPRCVSKSLTGLECAGCGSTRATHHLLNGRVGPAWRHNPAMIVLGLPLGLWAVAELAAAALTGRGLPRPPLPRSAGWIALAALVLFSVVRNIPHPAFESLRPPPIHADGDRASVQE